MGSDVVAKDAALNSTCGACSRIALRLRNLITVYLSEYKAPTCSEALDVVVR